MAAKPTKKPRTPAKPKTVKPVSPSDAAVLERHRARREARPRMPSLTSKVVKGVHQIDNSHSDPAVGGTVIADALGTAEHPFVGGIISQIISATAQGSEPNLTAANFMLTAIKGIGPQDEAESMLATQMAATHMLAMRFAAKLANPSQTATLEHLDGYASRVTKLTRTFAQQLDALKRYRTGGEQKVTVQHVNVNDGGQAIVGNVIPSTVGRG